MKGRIQTVFIIVAALIRATVLVPKISGIKIYRFVLKKYEKQSGDSSERR